MVFLSVAKLSISFKIVSSYTTKINKEIKTPTMVSIMMVRFPWPSVNAT